MKSNFLGKTTSAIFNRLLYERDITQTKYDIFHKGVYCYHKNANEYNRKHFRITKVISSNVPFQTIFKLHLAYFLPVA